MQTLDSVTQTPTGALASPAVARNTAAILAVLKAHLPASGQVLEIAAGSGEHALAFSAALPGLSWIPSDPSTEARASIDAWRDQIGTANLAAAVDLDAARPETWPSELHHAVVCINMIHISPWAATQGLMAGAAAVLRRPGGLLFLYGPYREAGIPLAPSNAAFDDSLKARNLDWGLRDLDAVVAEARRHGLHLTRRIEMPANNLSLIFRHV
ncbi:DUF938 domain-containing protein [Brevundimonas sp.]|uniref:DUF938 domain-containing protein n=1 Tax=Brevundimonas sp. TaxID=1871086 RepID=UPI003BA9EE8A